MKPTPIWQQIKSLFVNVKQNLGTLQALIKNSIDPRLKVKLILTYNANSLSCI